MNRPAFVQPPTGALLYRVVEDFPYIVLRHDPSRLLYIGTDGWSKETLVAGPFAERTALRAWRLANVRVPDGCDLGPWQSGFRLFVTRTLPYPPNDWSAFDPSWLPPSITFYATSDDPTLRIEWGALPAGFDAASINTTFEVKATGVLARSWSVHPAGSPVLAESSRWNGACVIVDLPPPGR